MGPPKQKKCKPTPPPSPIPSLPYWFVLQCVASISRLYYPSLALVSKSFRSLLASRELYDLRSRLGNTESCLYVCVDSYFTLAQKWYTLCRKPDRTIYEWSCGYVSCGYALAPVSSEECSCLTASGLVAVGSDIYSISVPNLYGRPDPSSGYSSKVLDCKSHTWREAPGMKAVHDIVSACVLDKKIYALGLRVDVVAKTGENSFQVFDTEEEIWHPLPAPDQATAGLFSRFITARIDGKIYAADSHGYAAAVYNPEEHSWDNNVNRNICRNIIDLHSKCVIGNVLYSLECESDTDPDRSRREVRWYDTVVGRWREVIGLKGAIRNFNHPGPNFRLANYGGKLAILWEINWLRVSEFNFHRDTKKVWGAVVALERRQSDDEICGKVEWCDELLTIPIPYRLLKGVAVTV